MAENTSTTPLNNTDGWIRKYQGIPADLQAMSREQCLARLEQLFKENPGLHFHECGRTDPYISDNDLRTMVEDAEWCLGLRK